MSGSLEVVLTRGVWAHGTCCRDVELRALTGPDQMALMEDAAALSPAQWTTEVLARCLTRLGSGPVTREAVRSLTVGDREALLLHLRRLMAGDRLPCVATCPSPACGQALEFELSAADLLRPPAGVASTVHEMAIAEAGLECVVHFRLPNGADQEAAGLVAATDLEGAAELLWRRCVDSLDPADGAAGLALREAVSARMAELDPQAELTLNVACPACSGTFSAVFDTASYLLQEFGADIRRLDREVHVLAYHYHWGPSEILAMSSGRRRRYLQLLEEELAQEATG
jgi:hypothetical protein